LLTRPWRGTLGSQIVKDQQWHAAHQLKALVIRDGALRPKRRPQVIEQIRYNCEQHRFTSTKRLMRDRRRQVGFADAIRAEQRQPAARLPGIRSDRRDHSPQPRNEWVERGKCLVVQTAEIAQARSLRSLVRCSPLLRTGTGKQHAKVRMSERHSL